MPLHLTIRSPRAALRQQSYINAVLTQSRARTPIFQAPALNRTYGSGPNPNPGRSPLKVWPFIAITLLGTGSYTLMVRSRAGEIPKPRGNTIGPA